MKQFDDAFVVKARDDFRHLTLNLKTVTQLNPRASAAPEGPCRALMPQGATVLLKDCHPS